MGWLSGIKPKALLGGQRAFNRTRQRPLYPPASPCCVLRVVGLLLPQQAGRCVAEQGGNQLVGLKGSVHTECVSACVHVCWRAGGGSG